MRHVEFALLADPRAGVVVAGTGGIRKLRAPLPGRGKRGGARVLYVYVEQRGRVYFLLAYAKNEQVGLTPTQKKALSRMVTDMEELAWPPK
ncbi:MAG: type II toxin-antitoxin system RelE/ParE family toxin [Gemmatimonadales bacterium]|nr:type II toxin-antitoxin system RelE/ParE family toxin [Gemmatimonadales bacterium]